MTYYVQGKTIPDGTSFFDATPYPTVEAAVEGAGTKMGLGSATAWIVDHGGNLVMSEAQVRRALAKRKSN